MKSFNINSEVLVKITPAGEKAWNKYYKALKMTPPPIRRDTNGYTRMQAWEVMNKFGSLFFLGNATPPIETNILIP